MQQALWSAAAAPDALTRRQRPGNGEPPPALRPPPRSPKAPREATARRRDKGTTAAAARPQGAPSSSPPRLPQGRRGSRTKMPASRVRPGPRAARSDATPPLHLPSPKKAPRECGVALPGPTVGDRSPRPPGRPAGLGLGCWKHHPPPRPLPHSLPVRSHKDHRVAEGTRYTAWLSKASRTRLHSPELQMRLWPLSGPRRGPTPPPRPS